MENHRLNWDCPSNAHPMTTFEQNCTGESYPHSMLMSCSGGKGKVPMKQACAIRVVAANLLKYVQSAHKTSPISCDFSLHDDIEEVGRTILLLCWRLNFRAWFWICNDLFLAHRSNSHENVKLFVEETQYRWKALSTDWAFTMNIVISESLRISR
jgi:hypothetical protein